MHPLLFGYSFFLRGNILEKALEPHLRKLGLAKNNEKEPLENQDIEMSRMDKG